ncbi:MAG: putative Ig domain-containing protein, partial [Planctomycetes bacterium]|nr:putative Ig domain-containing protein [Planctomycetota bacterium]
MRIPLPSLLAVLAAAALTSGCPADKTVYNTYSLPQLVQIQTTYLPDAAQGELYSTTLEAAGGSGTYLWSLQPGGTNDSWLSIDPATGELTGTSSTVFPVTVNVRVQDAENTGNFDNARFTFDVAVFTPTLLFATSDPLPAAGVSQPYTQTLAVSGGSGTYTFTKRTGGTNDAWVSVAAATGALSGTPAATGTTQVIVRAVDDANPLNYVQKTFTIEIKTVAITTSSLPGAYIGQAYSQTLAAQGGSPPYAWSVRAGGVNYAWLTVNPTTGAVTGTPTVTETGTVVLIVRVTDASSNYDIRAFEFSASPYNPPVIAATTLANAFVNEAYARPIPATGGSGPLKYTITGGTNHAWLTLNDSTGMLTGTPADANAGAVTLDVRVEEANNPSVNDTGTLAFTVLGVRIATVSMPNASTALPYSFRILSEGGSGYYAWSLDTGGSSNHAWGTLNADTGTFAGTAPATVSEVVLAVNVEDALNPGYTHSAVFRFNVVSLLYAQGFESGVPAGWTATGDWGAGVPAANYIAPYPAAEGTRIAGTNLVGNYTQNRTWGSCDLTTANIAVPASTDRIMLTYVQWFQTEPGDGGILRINDSVTGWAQAVPVGGYVAKVDPAGANLDGFTGFGGAWRRIYVDVSASQSHTIQVQWRFFSDNDTTVAPGWYIDDLRIYEISATSLPVKAASPGIPDGSTYAPPAAG